MNHSKFTVLITCLTFTYLDIAIWQSNFDYHNWSPVAYWSFIVSAAAAYFGATFILKTLRVKEQEIIDFTEWCQNNAVPVAYAKGQYWWYKYGDNPSQQYSTKELLDIYRKQIKNASR